MFKSAFFRRLFLPYLLLICCAILIVGLLSARRLRATYLERTTDGLRKNSLLVAQLIASNASGGPALDQQIIELGQTLHCRITVMTTDGTVLADNEANALRMENHRYRSEVIAALAQGEGSSVRRSDTIHEDMLYFARHVQPGNPSYLIRLSVHLHELDQQLAALYRGLTLTGVVATVLAGLFCFFFTRRHTIPVVELTTFADAIAHGDLSRRIVREGGGEIEVLGDALNSMADSLGRLIDETNRDKAELLAMLSSMTEAVIAIDADERIVVSNAAAKRLFELDSEDVLGRRLWEVIRQPTILQAATQVLKSSQPITFALGPVGGRHLQVTAAPILHADSRNGLVIVAFDATEAVRYEELRKEFVANVSHELRTPLTAIKGFAETLLQFGRDDPDRAQQHLQVIEKNADQLMNLVDDLLELSRLENSSDSSRRVPLDVSALVRHTVDLLSPIAEKKNQTIELRLDLQLPQFNGAPDYLERAVSNLVDNAIKYTRPGGRITIVTRAEAEWIYVEVSDTGIGIPPADVSRIFERFYRVDRSRSREMGGTGLGLSIVKHVIQSHGGTVEATSTLGQGSTFTIRLPRS